jgi:hypothetical protein
MEMKLSQEPLSVFADRVVDHGPMLADITIHGIVSQCNFDGPFAAEVLRKVDERKE